ncbi:MAG: magnesium transporter, partial [Planctomycetes bacterium]|nr:magnesium transporter [Planctomycetota bacterium]
VTVFDVRRESATNLCEMGADWADTPRELSEASEVVLTSLPGPVEAEEVLTNPDTGILAGLKSGGAWIDTTTNAPTVITKLADICDRDYVAVYAGDDQEVVVQIIRKYDAFEAAVIDADGRLVGRITHDDLFDVAEEEAAEDMYRMAGTDPAELETSSVLHAARIRLTWLLPCMAGMLLTAIVLNQSRPNFDLALFAALVLFVPMIGATGGNSGIQISTVIVRGFATGELASTKVGRALAREGRIALAMAPVCGLTAWGLVSLLFPVLQKYAGGSEILPEPERVALAVGAGMTAAVLMAAFLGIALPFGFRKLGVDPAISSGPLVTTLNDVVSVAVYMALAMWLAR